MSYPTTIPNPISALHLLVLKNVDQSANVRQYLDGKLIVLPDGHLGLAARADASRRTRDYDRAGRQRGALRQEADQFGDTEDQVTVYQYQSVYLRWHVASRGRYTYSVPHSCMTSPFFRPRICSAPGSGMSSLETIAGPMGQDPSKPLE